MSADAGVVVHGPAAWRDGLARRARALLLLSALCSLLGLFGALHWALELFSHFLVW